MLGRQGERVGICVFVFVFLCICVFVYLFEVVVVKKCTLMHYIPAWERGGEGRWLNFSWMMHIFMLDIFLDIFMEILMLDIFMDTFM